MEIILIGSSRRKLFSWSAEARALFSQIAQEVSGQPGVRLALKLKRPAIFCNRQIAAAAFEDGIAARLGPADKARALQVPGSRELRWRDQVAMRGMVALPWSVHDQWRDFVHAATGPGVG